MQRPLIRAVVLLGIALAPLLFIVCSLIHQQWAKWEMTERLETSRLTTLTIAEKNLHWIKPGKEILINGRLFDIKSSVTRNGICYIKGLYDEEETAIVQHIQHQMHKEQGTHRLHQSLLCYLLFAGNPSSLNTHSIQSVAVSHSYWPLNEGLISPPSLDRMTPPPQC